MRTRTNEWMAARGALGGALAAGVWHALRTPLEMEADRIFDRSVKQFTRSSAVQFSADFLAKFESCDLERKRITLRELNRLRRQAMEPIRHQMGVEIGIVGSTKSYSKARTEAALAALVELGQELERSRLGLGDDIVLIGGLATYLLTKGFFDHCGSHDIDFMIKTTRPRGKAIREIITSLGYEIAEIATIPDVPGPYPQPFSKTVIAGDKDDKDDKEYSVQLNFWGEWPGMLPAPHPVVRDLLDITFIFNLEKEIEAVSSKNRTERTTFRVVDLAGLLVLKVIAGRPKDYYNVFALTHCNGGPLQAAESFRRQVSESANKRVPKMPKRHLERLKTTIKLISCEFKTEWSDGARSVVDFDKENKKQKADAVAKQVTQFVESASQVRDFDLVIDCQTCHLYNHSSAACFIDEVA